MVPVEGEGFAVSAQGLWNPEAAGSWKLSTPRARPLVARNVDDVAVAVQLTVDIELVLGAEGGQRQRCRLPMRKGLHVRMHRPNQRMVMAKAFQYTEDVWTGLSPEKRVMLAGGAVMALRLAPMAARFCS